MKTNEILMKTNEILMETNEEIIHEYAELVRKLTRISVAAEWYVSIHDMYHEDPDCYAVSVAYAQLKSALV